MHKTLLTRRTALGLAGLGAAALVAGCSSDATDDTSTDDSTTEEEDASDESEATDSTDDASATGVTVEGVDVETTYGPVQGVAEDDVLCWYGIPYGKEPSGDLRWQAPEAPDTWTSTLDCTAAAEVALQLSSGEVIGSEDALRLDVVSAEGATGRPVLVYIHGGNNQTGQSSEIPGNDLVANTGCVYVSLNYRLGLLGFNCLPAIRAQVDTGNFAMQDIAFALDWIQDNIANFGGDPSNVTISGFSAGGRDVMAILASPYFAGKFHKAISYSGGMTTCNESVAAQRIAEEMASLVVEDGLADDEDAAVEWLLGTDSEVLDWLYSVDSSRLVPLCANANIRMAVFPHLYEDGVVVPECGFNGAEYNSVPLIMLTGSTEFSFFELYDSYWSTDEALALDEDELANAITFGNTYGSDMYRIFNAQESADAMMGLYDSNIYVCQVDYGSASSPMSSALGSFGAFHGIFVPMISTVNSYSSMLPGVFEADGYVDMASQYNAYLKNFLETGDPNGDDLVEWEPWARDNRVSLVLDADETSATVELADVSKAYEDIIGEMRADDTIAESTKTLVATNVMNGRWFSAAVDEYYGGNWVS